MANVNRNDATVQYCEQHMNPEQFGNFLKIADFLGIPSVKPNLTICKSTSQWDLWELWTGFNQVLSDFLQEDVFKIGSWITRLFPREEYKGGVQGTLIRYVYESQVLDEVPDQAPNTILEAFQEKHEFSLVQRGSSFVLNNDFMYAPNGPQVFAEHCRQLERSLDNTIAESVLIECKTVGVQEFVRKIRGPLNPTEFWRTITRLVDWFGAYQKTPNGADKIESKGVADLNAQAITPDVGICPATAIRYFKNVDAGHTVFARGGDTIYDKRLDTDDNQILSVFHGIILRSSRAFKQPQNRGVRDPFFETRTVGEFYSAYPLADEHCSVEDYRSSFRQIVIGDAQKIHVPISLNEMVTKSIIFDPQDGCILPGFGNRILRTCIKEDWRHTSTMGRTSDGWSDSFDCPPGGGGGVSRRRHTGQKRKRGSLEYCGPDSDDDDHDHEEAPSLGEMYAATGLTERVIQLLNHPNCAQQSEALRARLLPSSSSGGGRGGGFSFASGGQTSAYGRPTQVQAIAQRAAIREGRGMAGGRGERRAPLVPESMGGGPEEARPYTIDVTNGLDTAVLARYQDDLANWLAAAFPGEGEGKVENIWQDTRAVAAIKDLVGDNKWQEALWLAAAVLGTPEYKAQLAPVIRKAAIEPAKYGRITARMRQLLGTESQYDISSPHSLIKEVTGRDVPEGVLVHGEAKRGQPEAGARGPGLARAVERAQEQATATPPAASSRSRRGGGGAPPGATSATLWDADQLKQVPIDLNVMRALIAFNLYLPLGFLLARPHISFTAGSYLLLKQGRETGVIYTNRMIVELTRNGKQRTIGVNLNFASQTVIKERKNFAFFPDVFITNYLGGYGCAIYDPRDQNDHSANRLMQRDMYVFAVPYHFRLATPYLDITGFVSTEMLQSFESEPAPMFPTAPIYRDFWNFPEPSNLFRVESFVDQNRQRNTFCCQGYQKYCIPKDMQMEVPTETLGNGHIGNAIDSKTFKVYRGEDDYLTDHSLVIK